MTSVDELDHMDCDGWANYAVQVLRSAGIENAMPEARWMLEHIARGRLGSQQLQSMLDRRVAGEPLQYVLGEWSFRYLNLSVDGRVLIPRPETEQLVERALAECAHLDASRAADLGTGSGAIALSLATEAPGLTEIWASDASDGALAVARANLAALGQAATRVRLAQGSWFDALPVELQGQLDVVVSNPPYVAEGEMADLPGEVRDWEPVEALVSGPKGLDAISQIIAEAPSWLARPGALLIELAPHQASEGQQLARAAGFTAVSVWPDLAGRDRILLARL